MVDTKRRKACAIGLLPMKKDCDFMRWRLSLMSSRWQVAKSIRPAAICFLKKLSKRSILCMYPMKQLCLDEPVTDCFTQRGIHHVLPFDLNPGCDRFIDSM